MQSTIGRYTTAAFVGLGVAIALSQGQLVSLRVWVFAGTTILVGSALVQLVLEARVSVSPMVPAWWPIRRARPGETGSIRSLRALEGIVRDAARNPRVHTLRLQPRLTEVAQHYLPLTHGIDLEHDPELAHEILGDVAWLIDPSVVDRAPTVDELDRFVHRVRNANPERLNTS
jgi:hypothetical protein